jgi:hypothetical protein
MKAERYQRVQPATGSSRRTHVAGAQTGRRPEPRRARLLTEPDDGSTDGAAAGAKEGAAADGAR